MGARGPGPQNLNALQVGGGNWQGDRAGRVQVRVVPGWRRPSPWLLLVTAPLGRTGEAFVVTSVTVTV